MAKFNPDIPDVNPQSYMNYARPISEYQGDMTGGTILKGIGDVFKTAVTGADEIIKDTINRGLRSDLSGERDIQTGALESMVGIPADQRVSPYQATPTNPESSNAGRSSDIIPGSVAEPLPSQFQSLDKQVAGVNTGSLTKPALGTYYTGKLDMITKDYRSQYPGYADYIDERVQAITGMNPANKRVDDLMTILQTVAGQAHQEKEKALGEAASNSGIPGMADLARKISNNQVSNPMAAVIDQMAPWKAIDYQAHQTQEANANWKSTNENKVTKNEQDASSIANKISDTVFTQTIGSMGKSASDLSKMATDIQTGKKSLSGNEPMLYGQAVEAMGVTAGRQIEDKLNSKGPDGKSIADVIGPTKTAAIISEATSKYNKIRDMFINKETGSAFSAARYTSIAGSETSKWLLSESPVSDYMNIQHAATLLGGPAVGGVFAEKFLSGKMGSIDDTIKAFGEFNTYKLMSDPNSSLETPINYMKSKGVGQDKPEQRPAYQYFTKDVPSMITDTRLQTAGRAMLASNVFKGNITSKFDDDTFDDKGNLIPGKHTILSTMTNDKIRDSVWDLAGGSATSPLWIQYKTFVTNNTDQMVNKDVHDLNSLADNPNLKLVWDDKNARVGIDFKDTFFTNPYNSRPGTDAIAKKQADTYRQTVAMLNSTLAPISSIAQKEGVDPNKAILQQLSNFGLDPSKIEFSPEMRKQLGMPEKKATAATTTQAASNSPFQYPQLQDFSQSIVKPADEGQIKGTANAAHPDSVWGNPLAPDFKEQHLTTIQTPNGKPLEVNKEAAGAFKGFLGDLAATGYKLDDVQGYNLREKRGAGGISQHAFGNAIDINPSRNTSSMLGVGTAKTDLPKEVSDIAAKWGISWGGDWHNQKDYMHFEYTGRKPTMVGDAGYKLSQK